MKQNLLNKKIIILVITIPIVVCCACFLFLLIELSFLRIVNQTDASYPISLQTVSYSQISKDYKKITNYISGGASFNCPTKADVCSKIQNYYSSINLRNFESAYNYGQKIRDYANLVNTYSDTVFIAAGYIKEQSDGSFTAYVTYVDKNNKVTLYDVNIKADNNYINESSPVAAHDKFKLDCDYVNNLRENVCVFVSEDKISNLYANQFFYFPEFKQSSVDLSIFYSKGGDALSSWVTIYRYNSSDNSLTYIGNYNFLDYADVDSICTRDNSIDFSEGGCASKYLKEEELAKDKIFLNMVALYNIK